MHGIIKSYLADRGFGFIASEAIPKDIFFHISFVQNPNPPPQFGQRVEFRLDKDHAGRTVARDVKVLDGDRAPALPDLARRNVTEAAEALDPGKDRRRERRRDAEEIFRRG